MSIAQGVVLKTFMGKPFEVTNQHKAGAKETKLHHFYQVHHNGTDTRFVYQFCTPSEPMAAKEGDTVEFMYAEVTRGEYTNNVIDKKTFKVTNSAAHSQIQPTQQAPQQNVQTPVVAGGYDKRDEKIIFQNSMAHATAISIHNAKHAGTGIAVADVIGMAKFICHNVLNIDIKKWEEEIKKAQTVVPITNTPMQSNPPLPSGVQVTVTSPSNGIAGPAKEAPPFEPDFYPDDEIPNFS